MHMNLQVIVDAIAVHAAAKSELNRWRPQITGPWAYRRILWPLTARPPRPVQGVGLFDEHHLVPNQAGLGAICGALSANRRRPEVWGKEH